MKVRIEIDEKNGKAFTTEIHDGYYDSIRQILLAIHYMKIPITKDWKC